MTLVSRVAPWLIIGPALSAQHAVDLRQYGVRSVIDLRAEAVDDGDALRALGIEWHHVTIRDGEPPTDDQLAQIAQWVAETEGGSTYIHCEGGLGRSPTVAIALLLSRGYERHEAFRLVVGARPSVALTARQEAWLRDLEVSPQGGSSTDGGMT